MSLTAVMQHHLWLMNSGNKSAIYRNKWQLLVGGIHVGVWPYVHAGNENKETKPLIIIHFKWALRDEQRHLGYKARKKRQMAGSQSQPTTSGALARNTKCKADCPRWRDGVETVTRYRAKEMMSLHTIKIQTFNWYINNSLTGKHLYIHWINQTFVQHLSYKAVWNVSLETEDETVQRGL